MANYGPDDLIIEIDSTVGGSLAAITSYVREINGIKIEAKTQESHPFGVAWVEHLFTGIRSMADITLRGFYDDAASPAPNAIFAGKEGEQRSFKVTWGSTKTTAVEVLILSYERLAKVGELTMFETVLRPTGAVTEA